MIRYTAADKSRVRDLYLEGRNTYQIAGITGFPKTSVTNILHQFDIVRTKTEAKTKYSVQQDFFKKISTPVQAYILGFIYADGCNIEAYKRLTIQLSRKDEEHLYLIKSALKYSGPINHRLCGLHESSILSITNKTISSDLVRLGCPSNKSLNLQFPIAEQVPKSLIWHFIRGYFDGDGHVSRTNFQVYLCVNQAFGESFEKFLQSQDIFSRLTHTNSKIFRLLISKKKEAQKFFLQLYPNSDNLRLNRKYQIFLHHQANL